MLWVGTSLAKMRGFYLPDKKIQNATLIEIEYIINANPKQIKLILDSIIQINIRYLKAYNYKAKLVIHEISSIKKS